MRSGICRRLSRFRVNRSPFRGDKSLRQKRRAVQSPKEMAVRNRAEKRPDAQGEIASAMPEQGAHGRRICHEKRTDYPDPPKHVDRCERRTGKTVRPDNLGALVCLLVVGRRGACGCFTARRLAGGSGISVGRSAIIVSAIFIVSLTAGWSAGGGDGTAAAAARRVFRGAAFTRIITACKGNDGS
jgi:hypothetical protein